MAVSQIPNLPFAIALSGAELMEAVQGGASVKVLTNQLKNLFDPNNILTGGNISPQVSISGNNLVLSAPLAAILIPQPFKPAADTIANVTTNWPSGSIYTNCYITITDARGGGLASLCWCDGANWRRVDTNAIVI